MNIWFSPYQLHTASRVNSQVKSFTRQGALLRVRFADGRIGYSDICPFPEMGDSPLELILKDIKKQGLRGMAERSLYCAKIDAAARAANQSLYVPAVKIKNHYSINDILNFDLKQCEELQKLGYTEYKVKLGAKLVAESAKLLELTKSLSSSCKLRLDFNLSLNRPAFCDWFESHQSWLRPYADFFEDPFAYQANDWQEVSQKYGIRLALDFAADPILTEAKGAQIIVIKPARQNAEKIVNWFLSSDKNSAKHSDKKFVFTHYMDFAVGQMFAFAEAQRLSLLLGDRLVSCGLQLHQAFTGLALQNEIQYHGPFITPPAGIGIGFDQPLADMSWTEIN